MMDDRYDVIVLGSGTGGYACALRVAELGKKVTIVEKDDRLGGTCLLRGCVPTKALLETASLMDHVRDAEHRGVRASGKLLWAKVLEFAQGIVEKKVSGLTGLIKARGIEVIRARA